MSIIKLEHISKRHDKTILDDINITVNEGDFVCISGPSGCGKSTLLQIIGLLEPASSGQYILNGCTTTQLNSTQIAQYRHKHFGFVFQRYHLVKHLTAIENIMLPLQYGQHSTSAVDVMRLLHDFKLEQYADYKPHQLSYGQQQRIALIRAIITKPTVLLADEPTGSLDQENSTIVMDQLRDLHSKGMTVILITHDLSLIMASDQHYQILNQRLEKSS